MNGVALEVLGVSRRFRGRVAVREMSFVAREGEIVGLVGPNGAGKTTAIRVLSTVLVPSSGEFRVAGIPHSRPIEIRRRIGVLPESSGYPRNLTGAEYLRFHARLFGLGRVAAKRAAERLLVDVGLGERAATRISTYSLGMRQRLGIARALVNDPSVIFLDEPALGLDPAGQRDLRELLRSIAGDRGTTVVLSTHILSEVEELCSTVLILEAGAVRFTGTTSDVLRVAGVRRLGRLRVPVDMVDRARAALAGSATVLVEAGDERDGVLTVSVAGEAHAPVSAAMNVALQQVLAAGVPVLGFEVDSTRLGTAFLTLTGEEAR